MAAGDEWPCFLYENNKYDPSDPWHGFFQTSLLVKVSRVICSSL